MSRSPFTCFQSTSEWVTRSVPLVILSNPLRLSPMAMNYIYSISLYSWFQQWVHVLMHTDNINWTFEYALQIIFQGSKEKRIRSLSFHTHINIAIFRLFVSWYRTENAQSPNPKITHDFGAVFPYCLALLQFSWKGFTWWTHTISFCSSVRILLSIEKEPYKEVFLIQIKSKNANALNLV